MHMALKIMYFCFKKCYIKNINNIVLLQTIIISEVNSRDVSAIFDEIHEIFQ